MGFRVRTVLQSTSTYFLQDDCRQLRRGVCPGQGSSLSGLPSSWPCISSRCLCIYLLAHRPFLLLVITLRFSYEELLPQPPPLLPDFVWVELTTASPVPKVGHMTQAWWNSVFHSPGHRGYGWACSSRLVWEILLYLLKKRLFLSTGAANPTRHISGTSIARFPLQREHLSKNEANRGKSRGRYRFPTTLSEHLDTSMPAPITLGSFSCLSQYFLFLFRQIWIEFLKKKTLISKYPLLPQGKCSGEG